MKKHSPVSADGNTAAVHVPNRGSESRRFRLVGRTSRIARARWPCAAGGEAVLRPSGPLCRHSPPSSRRTPPLPSPTLPPHHSPPLPSTPPLPASPCLCLPLPSHGTSSVTARAPPPPFPVPSFLTRSCSPALAPVSRLPLPSLPVAPPVARSPKFSGKRRRRGLTHSFFVLCSFVQNVAAGDVGFIDSKKEGTCLVPDIAAM